jgi:ATP-dependent Lhr-like helicase
VNLPPIILDWFAARGWQPRRHQLEMLDAAGEGRHALLVAATGAGKTLAGFLPSLSDLIANPSDGLHTLYISPLKALATDVRRNLLTPVAEMGLTFASRRAPATRRPTARRGSVSSRRTYC